MYLERTVDEEIEANLTPLVKAHGVYELRVLNMPGGIISGYFDDLQKLALAAERFDGKSNVFFTLNPVKKELLARANNRLVRRPQQTTSDADIERLTYLPIDLDPKRAAGISSTDQEHELAFKKARQIQKYLQGEGWPSPFFADSGNGYHLLYGIDLDNTEANRQLLKQVLQVLDLKFSSNKVHVDTTTYNPARIWKVYGTIACKGDDTPERPHRRSCILEASQPCIEVSRNQLQELAQDWPEMSVPTKKKSKGQPASSKKDFDLNAWLKDHDIAIAMKGRWQSKATKYIPKVCPWNAQHTNRSAYVIEFDDGGIAAGCHHDSCANESWKTLRSRYEPDWQDSANASEGESEQKEKLSDRLIKLASQATLFKNELDEAYARVPVNDHEEIMKVKGKTFEMWLRKQFYDETGKAVASDAMNEALLSLETLAFFNGQKYPLHRRVAQQGDHFYYDLTNEEHQAVEITAQGCKIVSPPILFVRNKNAKAQVKPNFTGTLDKLEDHFNFKSADDLLLYKVYLVSCFIPNIPHPVLILSGEKGAAKSTSMRLTKAIVDPATQDLLTMPNSKADLVLTLSNSYMPAFDNLDGLSAEKSDVLCMASTGGGFAKRKLYTDEDETILQFKRCVMLNGINVVATRPDLLDRSIILELERIDPQKRKEESQIWTSFQADLPKIVGGIFQALPQAMKLYPDVQLPQLPRMADFTCWGYAIAEALGIGGEEFVQAYLRNQDRTNVEALSAHPVAAAIVSLMANRKKWSGSVASLLDELEGVAQTEKINTHQRSWPKASHILSRRLKEVKSNLEQVGITFDIRHGSNSKKITIYKDATLVNDSHTLDLERPTHDSDEEVEVLIDSELQGNSDEEFDDDLP